jgi:hypothetical protein
MFWQFLHGHARSLIAFPNYDAEPMPEKNARLGNELH